MRCDDVSEKFDRYLDGELRVTERLMVDVHVTQCYFCRETLAEYRAVEGMVRHAIRQPAPVDAYPELLARIRREERRAAQLPRVYFQEIGWRAVLASTILVVAGISASWVGGHALWGGGDGKEEAVETPAFEQSFSDRRNRLNADAAMEDGAAEGAIDRVSPAER